MHSTDRVVTHGPVLVTSIGLGIIQCVSEMEPDMVHLSFLVTGNVSTVENKLTIITNDVS